MSLSGVLPRPLVENPDSLDHYECGDGDPLRRAIAAFTHVAASLIHSETLDELLHTIVDEIMTLVGVERCSIYLRDGDGGTFRGRVGRSGTEPLDHDVQRLFAGGPADGLTRELLETRRPVVVHRAKHDPRTVKSTVRLWKIRSLMVAPMLFGNGVVGVVSLDDVDRPHDFSDQAREAAMAFLNLATVAVVEAGNRQTLATQLIGAHRRIKALQRAAAVDELLSELAHRGVSLQHLLDAVAELLAKPCAVFDRDGVRVAAALPPSFSDPLAPRLLEPDVAAHPAVREAFAQHNESRAFVIGPLPAADLRHRHVVAPIRLEDQLWGHLVLMEHGTGFRGGDIISVRRAATLAAVQLERARRDEDRECDAGAAFVAEMLVESTDTSAVLSRGAELGVRLDIPRAVLFAASRDGDEASLPSARAVVTALQRIAPGRPWHAATFGGGVAVLAEVPPGMPEGAFVAELRATLEALLVALPQRDRLVGGVSRVHARLEGVRSAFDEARQVVQCVRQFAPPGAPSVRTAAELGAGRLFLATADGDSVAKFAEETFGELLRDRGKAELLMTLALFLQEAASARRTAAALGLHENTVRYRLTRIDELTGLAVMHDPESQLLARLALLVLLLQGRLPVTAS